MQRTGLAIYVQTSGGANVSLIAVNGNGQERPFSEATPAEILLHRVELNFTPFRDEVMHLWSDYPLDGYDRTQKKLELSNLAQKARETAEMLRETDYLGYFYVTSQLDQFSPLLDEALRSEDIDLMDVGATILNILEEPAYSQIPLRNMFEVAFDGMERATQQQRYKLLTETYAWVEPPVVDRYFPVRRITETNGDTPLSTMLTEYRVESLDDLHHLLFSLYFAQKKQRIVRCECCWGYFIPPTTRPALYCDRVIDGKSCKQVGPGLRHAAGLDTDAALRTYEALRHRMVARRERYVNAAPNGNGKLIHMDYSDYDEWDVTAQAARKAYLAGEINAEEFLRRIDICNDLESYEVDAPKKRGKSEWRQRVEADIHFDPYMAYQTMMTLDLTNSNMMMLDLGTEAPQWEIIKSEERIREARGDSQPLRDWKADREKS